MLDWKNSFVQYFLEGIKPNADQILGVEIEHFILDAQTKQAIPYSGKKGIQQVLLQLMKLYPGVEILSGTDFFGFRTSDFTITLEPASQLEISIAPTSSIHRISTIYQNFRQKLDSILSALGYVALTVGCQPMSHVTDLEILPKQRYALMDAFFRQFGIGGQEMMRGTASLQISIDYCSEQDFCHKIQAAYYYGPLLKLLCDYAPFFQGVPLTTFLKRTDIWRRVDPVRCGVLPNVFSPSYGFKNYVDFIGQIPPIFLKQGNNVVPTGPQSTQQLLTGKQPNKTEIAHILSMAFPDVRLKQFLEIRCADAVPLPFALAYCALIKGLFYSQEGLQYAQKQISQHHFSQKQVLQAEDALMKYSWQTNLYGRPLTAFAKEVLTLAKHHLPLDEQMYLQPFNAVIAYGGIQHIPADVCKSLQEQIAL